MIKRTPQPDEPQGNESQISLYFWQYVSAWAPALSIMLLAFGVWEIYVRVFEKPAWFLPPPSAVATSLWRDADILIRNGAITFIEVILGFVFASVAAMILSSAMALSRVAERAAYPFVIAAPTIPWLVIAPLFLIWFGSGLAPKALIAGLIAFFPIVVTTVDGIRSVDPDMVRLIRTFGANRWEVFRKVQLPSALPSVFSGLKVAAAVSVIGAVVGEWMGASEGLGHLMLTSKSKFLTDRVFAAMTVLACMGIGLFVLISVIEKFVVPWRNESTGKEG